MLSRFPKSDPIWNISNPRIVQRKAKEIYGKDMILYRSNAKNKKYYIITPEGHKVNFGSNMPDFTHHNDELRRQSYLKRSAGTNIRQIILVDHYCGKKLIYIYNFICRIYIIKNVINRI